MVMIFGCCNYDMDKVHNSIKWPEVWFLGDHTPFHDTCWYTQSYFWFIHYQHLSSKQSQDRQMDKSGCLVKFYVPLNIWKWIISLLKSTHIFEKSDTKDIHSVNARCTNLRLKKLDSRYVNRLEVWEFLFHFIIVIFI